MYSYVDNFHHCLLSVTDAAPAKVQDRFLHGLAPEARCQVLVQQPVDFVTAALVTEHLGGMMGEAPHEAAAGHQSPTPM